MTPPTATAIQELHTTLGQRLALVPPPQTVQAVHLIQDIRADLDVLRLFCEGCLQGYARRVVQRFVVVDHAGRPLTLEELGA